MKLESARTGQRSDKLWLYISPRLSDRNIFLFLFSRTIFDVSVPVSDVVLLFCYCFVVKSKQKSFEGVLVTDNDVPFFILVHHYLT